MSTSDCKDCGRNDWLSSGRECAYDSFYWKRPTAFCLSLDRKLFVLFILFDGQDWARSHGRRELLIRLFCNPASIQAVWIHEKRLKGIQIMHYRNQQKREMWVSRSEVRFGGWCFTVDTYCMQYCERAGVSERACYN